jgi:hypothetical protein
MAWVTATFTMSTATSTGVSLYSEDKSIIPSRKSLVRHIKILFIDIAQPMIKGGWNDRVEPGRVQFSMINRKLRKISKNKVK